ncbi:hypothetical protein [uncultured Dialister sp.]|uniref:hypothetical protein n=1 Tax=uncultured Dialister sp. TaxID=278064 RepID=UPI0025FBC1B1|nr:hypothetical protein [uncultured Dialister sp.]
MHDEQRAAGKERLARIILGRMNRRFYPLSCESFVFPSLSLDKAILKAMTDGHLPYAASRQVWNDLCRKYVHFRLELASSIVKEGSRISRYLEESVKDYLDFDITRSFSNEFENVRRAMAHFHFPYHDTGVGTIQTLVLISNETGTDLSALTTFFQLETERFIKAVKEEGAEYLEALSFCDPDFHERRIKAMPRILAEAIGEDLGKTESNLVMESAQILMPLTETLPLMKGGPTRENAGFFYKYIIFRAYVLGFLGSYVWQDRPMKESILKGVLGSKEVQRWTREMVTKNLLTDEDIRFGQRLYLKISMFMRQWSIFDPKNKKNYYRYYSHFAMFMANKMEEEGFENRVNELLDDFCHTSGAILSEEDRTFLIKETAAYVNTMAHTVYFAYGLGFRRPADFISQKWIPKEDHPVLKEIKNFFLGVEGKGVL